MYSPKIRDDLIPRIYAAAKEAGVAMTRWVNQVIETALADRYQRGGDQSAAVSREETIRLHHSRLRGGQ